MENTRQLVLNAVLMAILAAAGWGLASGAVSSDLQALWYAAEFLSRGAEDQVYAGSAGLFTMEPPAAWVALDRARGGGEAVYPYIYPPLWAALAGPLTGTMSFQTFAAAATLVNAILLVAIPALVWRIARPSVGFAPFVILGYAALVFSTAGAIAQFENQPQILVSFLIVAAIERDRSEHPLLAGAALALAAAIKLYPALFALFWLVTGRHRAVAAFAVLGGALGGLSVALAGWPLHAAFLAELSAISESVLHTRVNYNLHPVLASYTMPESFTFVPSLRATATGWDVAALPAPWAWVAKLLLVAAIAWLALLMRRSTEDMRARAVWPLAIGLLAFLSPLSWSYHYIPVVAWLPALIDLWPRQRAAALALAGYVPIVAPVVTFLGRQGVMTRELLLFGTAGTVVLLAAFALPALRALRPRETSAPETARPGLAPR